MWALDKNKGAGGAAKTNGRAEKRANGFSIFFSTFLSGLHGQSTKKAETAMRDTSFHVPILVPSPFLVQFSQFFSLLLSSLSSHGRIKKVCEKWTLCPVKTILNHLFCSVLLIFFSSNSGMLDKYFHILVSS